MSVFIRSSLNKNILLSILYKDELHPSSVVLRKCQQLSVNIFVVMEIDQTDIVSDVNC